MKNFLKKYRVHLLFIAILIISGFADWINIFCIVNLLYAFYIALNIVRAGIQHTEKLWRRIIDTVVMSLAGAVIVPFVMIPSVIFGINHSFNHPDYQENIIEYQFDCVVLKDACYIKNDAYFACEGTLSEKDFLNLARVNAWKLETITSPELLENASMMIKRHLKQPGEDHVMVTKGFFYSSYNGTDRGEKIVYCLNTHRFYYLRSSR